MTSAREEDAAVLLRRIEELLEEMVTQQRAKVLALARRLDPALNAEDLLSPEDCPGIAQDPRFNFEDGLLAGLGSARTAIRARIMVPRLDKEER